MKKIVSAVAVVALLGVFQANAVVVFNDTFDTTLGSGGVWDDLNSNDLASRQAAGTTNSTYTLGLSNGRTLIGPAAGIATMPQPLLMRSNFGTATNGWVAVDLDTDFGSDLAGGKWSFSYDGRVAGTAANGGWAGFSIGNPADTPNGAGSAIGINIFQGGGVAVWSYGSVLANPNIPTPATLDYTIDVEVDEVAGTIHATFTDANNPAGHDLGTHNITFADGSRFFEFRNFTATGAADDKFVDFRVDNVLIELDEAAVAPPIGDISTELLSTGLALTWASTNGFNYAVQSKDDLITGSWTNHITGIPGVAGDLTVTTAVDQAQSFYRVVVEE